MKKFNYYIFSNFDFYIRTAGATRMLYYAKALASQDNKVFLVSCCETKIDTSCFKEIEHNIFLHLDKKITRRFYYNILFLKRLLMFSKSHDGNSRFIFYPSPLVYLEILSLIYLRFIKKQKVFYELNEIRLHTSTFHAPLTIGEPIYSLKKLIYKTVFFLMQYLLYFYTGLICISTNMESYAKRFNDNIIRVPILTDPFVSLKIDDKKSYARKGHFNIGFSGTIHPSKENLLNFIETLGNLVKHNQKIVFNLCGMVTEKDFDTIFKSNTYNVELKYYGKLNQNELSSFLHQQNLLVIPRGYTLQNKFGFSTKLSDYLNHKKVILITDISDNSHFIKDDINGYIVPPNSDNAMLEKLLFIIRNYDKIEKRVIDNAYLTSIENFHYKLYSSKLFEFMQ